MKKMISCCLAVLLLATALSGCSLPSANNDLSADSMVLPNISSAVSSESSDTSQEEAQPPVTIQEQVLLDEKDIHITATGLDFHEDSGAQLQIQIENHSNDSLTVQARRSSVNGYMLDAVCSIDAPAGETVSGSLLFLNSSLALCGITTVADMEFTLALFYSADWSEYLVSQPVRVTTSAAADYAYPRNDDGRVLYEQNDLRIVSKGLSGNNSLWGPGLLLFIENNGSQPVTLQSTQAVLGETPIDILFLQTIDAGKCANAVVSLIGCDLEENSTSKITGLTINFTVVNADTQAELFRIDPIALEF